MSIPPCPDTHRRLDHLRSDLMEFAKLLETRRLYESADAAMILAALAEEFADDLLATP